MKKITNQEINRDYVLIDYEEDGEEKSTKWEIGDGERIEDMVENWIRNHELRQFRFWELDGNEVVLACGAHEAMFFIRLDWAIISREQAAAEIEEFLND